MPTDTCDSFVLPKVTVYIPTCNRLPLLQRAIHSVMEQTYSNVELIVVDDCSNDGTWDYLEHKSSLHHNLIIIKNTTRMGACVSRNKAIWRASGVYITGLDDDDYFERNRISGFVDCWSSMSDEPTALYSDHAVIRSNGLKKIYKRPKSASYDKQFLRNAIGNQVFTRTSYLKNIGGFDEKLNVWQDYECWLRLLKLGRVIKAPGATYVFDHSHDTPRITNSKKEVVDEAFSTIVKKHCVSGKNLVRFNLMRSSYVRVLNFRLFCQALRYLDILGAAKFFRVFLKFKILN
ncbi:glycosyltransferase [Halomonas mongoliensis]|uniref:glycosyltransferase n=1 Tax=Halomonas mongoliensis TaxID=321265 RepID=UPI00403AF68C